MCTGCRNFSRKKSGGGKIYNLKIEGGGSGKNISAVPLTITQEIQQCLFSRLISLEIKTLLGVQEGVQELCVQELCVQELCVHELWVQELCVQELCVQELRKSLQS